MRVDLTGHQLDITPAHRRLVTTKIARLERLLNDAAVSAQVVLSTERVGCRADVTLHARDERFLHSAGTGENFGAAIKTAIDKLVQQAQTVKGKWEGRRRRTAKPAPAVSVRKKPAAARTRQTRG